MNINLRKQQLLQKYLDNECSSAELEELFGYLKSGDDDSYEGATEALWNKIVAERTLENTKADRLLEKAIRAEKPVLLPRKWYRLAAAVLALAIGTGVVIMRSNKDKQDPSIVENTASPYKNDIKPGSTKAILQAGSMQVALNKEDTSFTLAGNVVHASRGNLKVADLKPVEYTLIVPPAGAYSLVLADGTTVWLNADSKLTYPSVFSGNKREVHLEGEAYFKIKKDPNHPFIVHTEEQDIKVLGTEFNVHAYSDEAHCVTTLVKGSVQVNSFGKKVLLAPGQQLASGKDGQTSLDNHANIQQVIAWKKGYFLFNNTGLREIMRDLSRWYDVKVHYEPGIKPHEFMAIMSRNNNISQILGMLEATGTVHFEIKGREIMVMPPSAPLTEQDAKGMR